MGHRTVLGIAAVGIALVSGGCSASTAAPTNQPLTISYVENGEPVSAPVVIEGVDCQIDDTSSIYSNIGGDTGFNAVLGQVNDRKTYTVSVQISADRGFISAKEFDVTADGLRFDDTLGRVAALEGNDVTDVIDSAATLTGAITCDN